MSSAAHEPRRIGPRRADSPSGSKVTPRRNGPDASEPNRIEYDSQEVPVLIRLPNLRDIDASETPAPPARQHKRHRVDQPSSSNPKSSQRNASKKSFQQHARHNKVVLGGVVGGVLVVAALFLFNANGPQAAKDQDGWANQDAQPELLVDGLDISLPSESEPPPLYPGFASQAPETEDTRFVSGELDHDTNGLPASNQPSAPRQSESLALPSKPQPVEFWPWQATEPAQAAGANSQQQWPGEVLSMEQGEINYPRTDSSGQVDYRSSRLSSESETYRMGKLDADRPQGIQGDHRSSILDGIIETPDTTSLR